jgi:hypothetical protein
MNHPRVKFAMGMLVFLVFARSWYNAGIGSYYQFFLKEHYGLTIQQAQIPVFLFLAAGVLGTYFGGVLADRFGLKNMIVFSIAGAAPLALILPHLPLFWVYPVITLLGFVVLSGFSVSVVYAQFLMPTKVGMASGLTTGFAFGMGAIGAVALGKAADVFGLPTVMWFCSALPLVGLCSLLLPSDRPHQPSDNKANFIPFSGNISIMGEVRQINGTGGNTMKNTARTLGITAALAVMIPLTAYAATATGNSSPATEKTDPSAWSAKGVSFEDHGGFGHKENIVSQEVLDLLKLDKAAFNAKIKAGSTLAKIAEEQGISRDSLKSAMTAAFNKKLEEQKQDFTANLDKIIDSDLQANKLEGRDGGFRVGLDFTETAKVLGLSAAQVKEQLRADKSLADLAKEKGVDVQKLIDAQKASITSSINQAVKDGKLTQAQADKQLADVANFADKIVNGKGFDKGSHHGGKGRDFGIEKPSEAEPVAPPTSS